MTEGVDFETMAVQKLRIGPRPSRHGIPGFLVRLGLPGFWVLLW